MRVAAASDQTTVPAFRPRERTAATPSYRYAGWRGYQTGKVAPGSSTRTRITITLGGHAEPGALAAALAELQSRHLVLAALYIDVAGVPWMRWGAADPLEAPLESDYLFAQTTADAHAVCEAVGSRPFDLAKSLFRVFLIRTPKTDLLVLSMHHLISDRISIGILARDFRDLYHAARSGARFPQRLGRLDYPDYLACLDEWLHGLQSRASHDYWRRLLPESPKGMTEPLRLGGASTGLKESGSLPFRLGLHTTSVVSALSRRLLTTRFTVLLAAQAVVVASLNDSDSALIAVVTDGRDHLSLRPIVGYMADKVHYNVSMSDDLQFDQLVRRLHEQSAASAAHRFIRYDYLQSHLWPEAFGSLYPSTFNFQRSTALSPPATWRGNTKGEFQPAPTHEADETVSLPRPNYNLQIIDRGEVLDGKISFSRTGAEVLYDGLCTVLDLAGDGQLTLRSARRALSKNPRALP